MAPTIIATDIHKSFGTGQGRQQILRGITLTIAAGETVFLVGPSGSGKTTLLSILGCILTPNRGNVQVMGREVASLRARDLPAFRRQHIGFIFQSFNLFPTLSGLDNVRLALAMQGMRLGRATSRAADLLDKVGLSNRAGLRPAQLSTGECQRVAVARALAANPSILLADEPTASLDAENGRAVMQLLQRLIHERGGSLIVVTHDERLFPFADRILRLQDGELTDEWQPESSAEALEVTEEHVA